MICFLFPLSICLCFTLSFVQFCCWFFISTACTLFPHCCCICKWMSLWCYSVLSDMILHTSSVTPSGFNVSYCLSFTYDNSGQLNSLFVNPVFPDGDIICLFVWSFKKFKYWCLSHIKVKLLPEISWGTRTGGWNMNVYLGLLLVILKYSKWYFWSTMALACCTQADTQRWIFQRGSDLAVTANG